MNDFLNYHSLITGVNWKSNTDLNACSIEQDGDEAKKNRYFIQIKQLKI